MTVLNESYEAIFKHLRAKIDELLPADVRDDIKEIMWNEILFAYDRAHDTSKVELLLKLLEITQENPDISLEDAMEKIFDKKHTMHTRLSQASRRVS